MDKRDELYFEYELATYGISYVDDIDTLFIGKGFLRRMEKRYASCSSPCSMIELVGDEQELVGVGFTYISHMIAWYWNGVIPANCRSAFIADLADFCFMDPEATIWDEDEEKQSQARTMHTIARLFAEQFDTIPEHILQRIRENT